MYDYIPYICAAGIFILGLIMAVLPEKATNKEKRDSEAAVKRTKRNGRALMLAGILLAAASYLLR